MISIHISPPNLLRPLVVVLGLLLSAAVHADCVDTVRLNAQEREFYLRANAALKSLLRPPPAVERIRFDDSITDPSQIEVCKGDKKPGDFTVGVRRIYVWPDPKGNAADTAVTLQLAINVRSFDSRADNYTGNYGSPSPDRSAGLKVNNVEWKVTDSGYGLPAQNETLRASIAAALERDRLQSLVGRPLPSVAESDAIARKAGPTPLVQAQRTPPVAPADTATGAATPSSAAAPASALPAPPPVATASPPTPADTVKDVVNTLQNLRGLFGR